MTPYLSRVLVSIFSPGFSLGFITNLASTGAQGKLPPFSIVQEFKEFLPERIKATLLSSHRKWWTRLVFEH